MPLQCEEIYATNQRIQWLTTRVGHRPGPSMGWVGSGWVKDDGLPQTSRNRCLLMIYTNGIFHTSALKSDIDATSDQGRF